MSDEKSRGVSEKRVAHSKSEYRRLTAQGADVLPPSAPSAAAATYPDTVAVPRDLLNAAACAINRDRWACSREGDTDGEEAMVELHDKISLLLLTRTPSSERVATDESGWLIENGKQGDELRYRNFEQGNQTWTKDPNEALRFARRVDAEKFSAEDEEAWRVVEHMWSDAGASHPYCSRCKSPAPSMSGCVAEDCAVKPSVRSSARLATEAVPVADIEAEIAHIEENGQRVKELPGMTDEWRCRELCAMYLREFISNLRANKRLAELSARPAEGVTDVQGALREIASMIDEAEALIASEHLAGNVVKEAAARGEHVGLRKARAVLTVPLSCAASATGEKKP